jgi:hypothetical protein
VFRCLQHIYIIGRAEHHLPNVTPCVAQGMDRGAGGCRTFLKLVELEILKPSNASAVELSDRDMCAPQRLEESSGGCGRSNVPASDTSIAAV